ncbi:MAG: hypothetical protein C4293_09555 [Nitrospiraceae bacterium]
MSPIRSASGARRSRRLATSSVRRARLRCGRMSEQGTHNGARAERSFLVREVLLPAARLIHSRVVRGAVLLASVVVALIWANSFWQETYFSLRETKLILDLKAFAIVEGLRHWINDDLMAVVFSRSGLRSSEG